MRLISALILSVSLTLISCGSGSSSSSDASFAVTENSITAISPAANSSAGTFTIAGLTGTKKFAVVHKTSTQTGISIASYDANGLEVAKVIFYFDKVLTLSESSFTESGKAIIKWSSSPGSALSMVSGTGNITFVLADVGTDAAGATYYTLSSVDLSSVTFTSTPPTYSISGITYLMVR